MAVMGGDQRQRMEAPAEDKFPEGLRVLAVDDDCPCIKVLKAVLCRCKYNATTVMDGMTALKILRGRKQEFDLLIMDVRMPGMDGFKLLVMDLPFISTILTAQTKVLFFVLFNTHELRILSLLNFGDRKASM
ncbi:two-component response regulator ORR24-like [Triticum dicoccoides]|uniref:two-component response regulator ORR24-like n=1 Tax=Triticum dicoccoides TaxID=85692 RepID=UPI001890E089|nr:two-component response regulator ORR24-like [Triticum dicoccoides]